MIHPLQLSLARLRRRARRLVVGQAVADFVARLVLAALLLMLADYALRFQDRGIRAIAWLALLTAAAVAARQCLRAWRASRFTDVGLAQRIERRFPALRGKLASAVEFLGEREDDPLAGSPQLRRAVILETTADLDRYDLRQIVDPRPARRAMVAALAACAAAAVLVALDAGSARIAWLRLTNPLNDVAWPRQNQLVFVDPLRRLAVGQDFEVEVRDAAGAPLPDDVRIQYRFENAAGSPLEESEPLRPLGGALVARRGNVQRSFDYRAVGGDDSTMPWITLEVVEPPAVSQLSIRLEYPAYTGWQPAAAQPNFKALVGTHVVVSGQATKPLSGAALQLDDETSIAAQLGEDGRSFSVVATPPPGWVLAKSGTYLFELDDRDGFRGAAEPRYEVRAIRDAPPTVDVEQPKANLFVTAAAVIPLRVKAKDDLALRELALHYLRSDASDLGEQTIVLEAGADAVPPELAAASAVEDYAGDERVIERAWGLAPLGLQPGTQLTFHVAATDYGAQVGQSLPRRLSIVTTDEIQDRLADRQAVIFAELARVLELEQNARAQVADLQIQLQQVGTLAKSDADALQGAGMNQQQVERELGNDREGVRGQIADFLDELAINGVDGPEAQRQMRQVLDELARLAAGPLAHVALELTAAVKAAQVELQPQPATASRQSIGEPLGRAASGQDEVIASLQDLLDELGQWVDHRRFHREVGQMRKAQGDIAAETAAHGTRTVAKSFEELPPQQQADLQKLVARQGELARRFDKLEQRMAQVVDPARRADPRVTESVADALAHARQNAVAGQMRDSARDIERNTLGQAAQRQAKVREHLDELLDILASRHEHELGRLVKKLREAEQQLAALAEQQEGLRKKFAAAGKDGAAADEPQRRQELERLARQQQQLRDDVERLARTLQRLQARQAGEAASEAGGKMRQAGDSGQQGDAATAAEQAAAAQRDLEQAQQELAEQRRRAESDLAQEQLARLEDRAQGLRESQARVLAQTQEYDQVRQQRGQWTRAEAAGLRDVAAQQSALRDESLGLADSLVGAEVFQFVLRGAARDMGTAGELLAGRETGSAAQAAQRHALARLEHVVDALAKDDAANEPPPEQEPAGGAGQGGQQQPGNSRSINELKLLRSMQQQINERTRQLAEAHRDSGRLGPAAASEFRALSEEQGRLADLILNMAQPSDAGPEAELDRLPDAPPAGQPDPMPDQPLPEGPS